MSNLEKKQGVPTGVNPDKQESCVRDLKGKPGVNPYAVCNASLTGQTKKSDESEIEAEHEEKVKKRKKNDDKNPDMMKPKNDNMRKSLEWDEDLGKSQDFTTKHAENGQWSIEPLEKKYMGFDKLKNKLESEGASNPGGLAAAIGRKKYGKGSFQHAAAAGKKMHKGESCSIAKNGQWSLAEKADNPDKEADAKLGEKVEHVVEDHMLDNAAAERKEGHKIMKDKKNG